MSRPQPPGDDVLGLDSSLEALQESSEFRGPVEPLDGPHCNDHFALVYETPEEQFAAAVPFLRQGLEGGERCIYVVDDESAVEVRTALGEADIDAEAALASGQLSLELVEDTYLRNGTFEPDEMIDFYGDVVERATEEWGALRIVAETSWLQQEDTSVEDFMEYEAKINRLFDDEDVIALCQYDRTAFDPAVVRDVVETHPHLIYRGTVCHNFYHTPPEEFFGPDQPDREVDRMLGTLLDRTEAKSELERREDWLRRQNEIISSPELGFEEKFDALLELGCERFDLDVGGMARVDPDGDRLEIEHTFPEDSPLETGATLPRSETYCAAAIERGGVATTADARELGVGDAPSQEYGFDAYLGTFVPVEGSRDRTFFFLGREPRPEGFSDDERTFAQLLANWVTYELEQHHRERRLERTVDRLERSNERLEQFAHAASHDLQEPLRMVSSYLQLVESRADEELSEDTREYLEFAVDGADRMREMIDGLLEYSRVETAGDPFEPVDLDVVLGEALDDLRLKIRETDTRIESESLPTVRGDAHQLREVLQNLLSNAIEYDDGGAPRVEVSAQRSGDQVVVSVADDGPGIEPDETDRVFDVFERLHSRDEHEGTGIGLALCERIVERHGGEIWVDSTPGEGSTFRFSLPAT